MLGQLKKQRDIIFEEQCLILLRKMQQQLSNFKHENKIFRAKFIFDGVDKYQEIQDIEEAISSGVYYIEAQRKAAEQLAKNEIKAQSIQTQVKAVRQSAEVQVQTSWRNEQTGLPETVLEIREESNSTLHNDSQQRPIEAKEDIECQTQIKDEATETVRDNDISPQNPSQKIPLSQHSVPQNEERKQTPPMQVLVRDSNSKIPSKVMAYHEQMKIIETKNRKYFEDQEDSSSRQNTHIVSAYRDQRIYERVKRGESRSRQNMGSTSSPPMLSHMVTPRIDNHQIAGYLMNRRSDENPNNYTQTTYSMRTAPIVGQSIEEGGSQLSHHKAPNFLTASQNTLFNHQGNEGVRVSIKNSTQQNWRYSHQVTQSLQSNDIETGSQNNLITIQEQDRLRRSIQNL